MITADGRPLLRASRPWGRHLLELSDGRQVQLRPRGVLNRSLDVDGVNYPLERRLRPLELLGAGLPLILAIPGVTGGALGFGLGLSGALLNARITRSRASPLLRGVSVVLVSGTLAAAYLGVALAVGAALPRDQDASLDFRVGQCYTGDTSGPETGPEDLTGVPCSTPHDAEVIGEPEYPEAPPRWPPHSAFLAFAREACPVAFEAFTGRPFSEATEWLFFFSPAEASWSAGEHRIRCIASAAPDSKLTGSLRATP